VGVTYAERPIYLVAFRDEWVVEDSIPRAWHDGIIAFGSRESAEKYASEAAVQRSIPVALFRIVEYRFSGNVSEG
jgi:hypothetical protein